MSRMRGVKRRPATRQPAVRVVVATEGELTEPEYLRLFRRFHENSSVRLVVIPVGKDPRAVVERAIEEKNKVDVGPLAARDSFWAMFDRDIHTRYEEARDLARGNGIEVALSNPCFELWGVLHYQDQNAPLERHACQRMLRRLCPTNAAGATKVFDDKDAIERQYLVAVERASRSVERREEEGKSLGNPSTTVHRLTEFIRCFIWSEKIVDKG